MVVYRNVDMVLGSLTMSQQCVDEGSPHTALVKQDGRLRQMTVPHYSLPLKSLVEAGFHFEALGTRKYGHIGGIYFVIVCMLPMYMGDLANIYKNLKGRCRENRLFPAVPCDSTRDNGHPQKHRKFPLNIRNHFFMEGDWALT